MRKHNSIILALILTLLLGACNQTTPKHSSPEPTSITLTDQAGKPLTGTLTLTSGEQHVITARVAGTADGVSQAVQWSTDNPDVASVTAGIITAHTAGSTTLTAASASHPNITASLEIKVQAKTQPEPEAPEIISIAITNLTPNDPYSKLRPTLGINWQLQLDTRIIHTGLPVADQGVTWSSSKPEILTINQAGTVTGKAMGEAVITATSTHNPLVSGSISINVTQTFQGRISDYNPTTDSRIIFTARPYPEEGHPSDLNLSSAPISSDGTFELAFPPVPDMGCMSTPDNCFAFEAFLWIISDTGVPRSVIANPGPEEFFVGWVYAHADLTLSDKNWPTLLPEAPYVAVDVEFKRGWNPVAVTGNILKQEVRSTTLPTTVLIVGYDD